MQINTKIIVKRTIQVWIVIDISLSLQGCPNIRGVAVEVIHKNSAIANCKKYARQLKVIPAESCRRAWRGSWPMMISKLPNLLAVYQIPALSPVYYKYSVCYRNNVLGGDRLRVRLCLIQLWQATVRKLLGHFALCYCQLSYCCWSVFVQHLIVVFFPRMSATPVAGSAAACYS